MGQGDESKKESQGDAEGGLPEFIVTGGAGDDAADTSEASSEGAAAELSPEEALAQAEAAAAAAVAAAEAAKAAAEAAAAKAAAEAAKAKTKGGKGKAEPAPTQAKAPQGKDKAPAKAAAKVVEPEPEPILVIKPSAEGLFEGKIDERAAEAFVPDEPFRGRRSPIAFGALAVVLLATVGGGVVIASSEKLSTDVQCFLDKRLDDCKGAEKRALEARWKDEDVKSRNRYGDLTLTYFPADAKVTVTKTTFVQEGLSGTPTKSGEETIKNATTELKPGQTIERLPILNIPIFEAEKREDGSVASVYTYEYQLVFEREGYITQTKTYRMDDWQRVGPGNEVISWPGLDLVPKPETLKANFAKAMTQIHCALKDNKKAKGLDAESLGLLDEGNLEILRLRNGFKAKADFEAAYVQLTADAEWWPKTLEEIQKNKCEE